MEGNWQLGFLITARSGFPFNPTTGLDNSLTGVGQDRPNVVGSPYVRDTSKLVWINAPAFAPNALGTFATPGTTRSSDPVFSVSIPICPGSSK